MTTVHDLETMLVAVTDSAGDGAAFLENARDREKEYCKKSIPRWLEVVRILEKHGPFERCLDIGTSPFTFALKRWCGAVETLDFTEAFRKRCEQAGITLHVGGEVWPDNLLPHEAYDCIVFLEVIEHMHVNPETVLLYLKRKLRAGGLLIMSTPNMMSLGNRVNMLLNKKLKHFHYPPFAQNEHLIHGHRHDRVFMPAEMVDYLENTRWSSFSLGYHAVAVCDGVTSSSPLGKVIRAPIQLVKHWFPSTRQLMLITARK